MRNCTSGVFECVLSRFGHVMNKASFVQLSATAMDGNSPGSSVYGILQARILEWVAMPSSRGTSPPKDRTRISSPELAAGFFTTSATRKALQVV